MIEDKKLVIVEKLYKEKLYYLETFLSKLKTSSLSVEEYV